MSLNRALAVSITTATLVACIASWAPSARADIYYGKCPFGYTAFGPIRRGPPGSPAVVLCKPTPGLPPTAPPTSRPGPTPTPAIPTCHHGFIMPVVDAKRRKVVGYICPPQNLLPK
jgi:hypothetical protein